MCKVRIDDSFNPNFVLYNLVFGSYPLEAFNADSLHAVIQASYGINLEQRIIQSKLTGWHKSGLLRAKGEYYVLA